MKKDKCEHLNVTCDDCGKQIYRGVTDAQRRLFAWDVIDFLRGLERDDTYILHYLQKEITEGNELAELSYQLLMEDMEQKGGFKYERRN
jgi:hypothetical protein